MSAICDVAVAFYKDKKRKETMNASTPHVYYVQSTVRTESIRYLEHILTHTQREEEWNGVERKEQTSTRATQSYQCFIKAMQLHEYTTIIDNWINKMNEQALFAVAAMTAAYCSSYIIGNILCTATKFLCPHFLIVVVLLLLLQ